MDPQFWFVVGRIGGLAAWFLLACAMLFGLAQSAPWISDRPASKHMFALRQKFSLLSLVFVLIHLAGLFANATLKFGVSDLLIPFFSTFEPRADVAWGVIAFWLLVATQITSRVRQNIPERMWRYIHLTSFLLFLLADVHSLAFGFDLPNPMVKWAAVGLSGLLLLGLLCQALTSRRRASGRRRAPAPTERPEPRPATSPSAASAAAMPRPQSAAPRPSGEPAPRPLPRPTGVTAMAMPPRPGPQAVSPAMMSPTTAMPAMSPAGGVAAANAQFYPLQIVDVHQETTDATTIAFAVPPALVDAFRFTPGQYLTLRVIRDGREVRRSYSICSGIADGELRVAVKRVEHGQISNWLSTWLQLGAVVDVAPPAGTFSTELNPLRARHILGVAAGIGMAPIISIAKSVLRVEPRSRCTLIYASRDDGSVVFRDELNWMRQKYAGRLRVLHVLSKDNGKAPGSQPLLRGRLTASKLHALAGWGVDMRTVDDAFVCAPDRMTTEITQALVQLGVAAEDVHSEQYEGPAMDAPATDFGRQAPMPSFPNVPPQQQLTPQQMAPQQMAPPMPVAAPMRMAPQPAMNLAPPQPMAAQAPMPPQPMPIQQMPIQQMPMAMAPQQLTPQQFAPQQIQPGYADQGFVQPAAPQAFVEDPYADQTYIDPGIANLPSPYPDEGYGQAGHAQPAPVEQLTAAWADAAPTAAVTAMPPAPAAPVATGGPQMTVVWGGQASAVPADGSQTVLDAGLAAGLELPYSCRAGFCGACRAAVVEGEFDPGNAAAEPGFIYTCQAKPLSPTSMVNFDA